MQFRGTLRSVNTRVAYYAVKLEELLEVGPSLSACFYSILVNVWVISKPCYTWSSVQTCLSWFSN